MTSLGEFLAFGPPEDEDSVRQFWQALGVQPDWLDTLVEVDPRWDGTKIVINASLQNRSDALEATVAVILYLWRWQQFSESRWCTIGASCRALIVSVVAGLEAVVAKCTSDPDTSNYYLNGFLRFKAPVRRYAAVAALAAYPADSLQIELLADDRVVRRLPELQDCIQQELEFLESLGPLVWERLNRVVGDQPPRYPHELRSETLQCAYTAYGFVDRRIFQVANSLPWSLALGDIAANLEALHQLDYKGTDSATLQIKELLTLQFNRQALGLAVELLKDVPWTSVTVEQGHGSMAVIHKLHPMLLRSGSRLSAIDRKTKRHQRLPRPAASG